MPDPSTAPLLAADQLVTGEAVALDLPPASLGLRLASGLIDMTIQFLLLFGGILLSGLVAASDALFGVAMIVTFVLVLVIGPAVLETLTLGRTVGKFALGIRTVRDDAGPISFHHAFVRHLVSVVEVWALSGVPALISAMVSSKGKRLGDYVAGTYVVRDRFTLRLPWPAQMPPRLAVWAVHRRHRPAAGLPRRDGPTAARPRDHAQPAPRGSCWSPTWSPR